VRQLPGDGADCQVVAGGGGVWRLSTAEGEVCQAGGGDREHGRDLLRGAGELAVCHEGGEVGKQRGDELGAGDEPALQVEVLERETLKRLWSSCKLRERATRGLHLQCMLHAMWRRLCMSCMPLVLVCMDMAWQLWHKQWKVHAVKCGDMHGACKCCPLLRAVLIARCAACWGVHISQQRQQPRLRAYWSGRAQRPGTATWRLAVLQPRHANTPNVTIHHDMC
jgi:hypothetical protein